MHVRKFKKKIYNFLFSNVTIVICLLIGRYRRKRDKLVDRSSAARIPTMWGPFTAYCYRSILDGIEHIAMVKVSNA